MYNSRRGAVVVRAFAGTVMLFATIFGVSADWTLEEWLTVERMVERGPMNQLIAWLNEHGADRTMPSDIDPEGSATHLIWYALRSGDMRRVQLFLDRGVPLDTYISRFSDDRVIDELAALGTSEADDLILRYATDLQITVLSASTYLRVSETTEPPDVDELERLIESWGMILPLDYKTAWWSVVPDRELRELILREVPGVTGSDPVQLYLDRHESYNGDAFAGFWRHQNAFPLVSSFLEDSRDYFRYHAEAARDGDLSTSWVEGRDGPGIGDSILTEDLNYQIPGDIEDGIEVSIFPGFGDERFFSRNNRLRRATLVMYLNNIVEARMGPGGDWYSEHSRITIEIPDEFEYVRVRLPDEYAERVDRTGKAILRLIIDDVYPGSDWDDTCIAEIVVHAPGAGPASLGGGR